MTTPRTPEQRLRELFDDAAHTIAPRGDGLAVIRGRVEARRSRRRWWVPVGALTAAAGIVAATVLALQSTGGDELRQEPQQPAQSGAPSSSASPSPAESATSSPTEVSTSGGGTPVWPFTTNEQAASWRNDPGEQGWAADPAEVATRVITEFLSLPSLEPGTAVDGDVVTVPMMLGDRTVCEVRLESIGAGGAGPWTVTGITSTVVTVTEPTEGMHVASPATLSGRVQGYDQSVHVRLLTDSGSLVAETHVPAGMDQPWSGSLSWSEQAPGIVGLSANLFDGKGDLYGVALVPVREGMRA